MSRPKLTIDQQISDMSDSKGILFSVLTCPPAEEYLTSHNYYYKLKAYAKNYPKSSDGKYIGLEFAALVELSRLDSYLRKEILALSIDVEHYLKVRFLHDISRDNKEDGYSLVQWFLENNPSVKKTIDEKCKNSSCAELYQKHKDVLSVWQLCELISFNDFINLFNSYYSRSGISHNLSGLLRPAKFLRNAAAHSNCIINDLCKVDADFSPSFDVTSQIGRIPKIKQKALNNQIGKKKIHDFCALIITFNEVAPKLSRRRGMHRLYDLFTVRMKENAELFEKNITIKSAFKFTEKVVDFYYREAYDVSVEQKTHSP